MENPITFKLLDKNEDVYFNILIDTPAREQIVKTINPKWPDVTSIKIEDEATLNKIVTCFTHQDSALTISLEG